MVAPTWITPGCVQFLESEKCFHTAWTQTGPGRLLMANPEFSRAQAVSAVRARHLISGVRTSQNYHLMIVVDRHTVVVFGADTA
jgi:hypothetical protein